jgi:hypothetical protein
MLFFVDNYELFNEINNLHRLKACVSRAVAAASGLGITFDSSVCLWISVKLFWNSPQTYPQAFWAKKSALAGGWWTVFSA